MQKITIETDDWIIETEDLYLSTEVRDARLKVEADLYRYTLIQKGVAPMTCSIPELYPENLQTLMKLVNLMPALASVDGVFEIEIRARVDDVVTWAVIGYGEAGDPCILRFEKDDAR